MKRTIGLICFLLTFSATAQVTGLWNAVAIHTNTGAVKPIVAGGPTNWKQVVSGNASDGKAVIGQGPWHVVTVDTNSGLTMPTMLTLMRVSPIGMIDTNKMTIELSGSAYWTNGVISMFPPTTTPNADVGVITVTILTENQWIRSLKYQVEGRDYMLIPHINSGGQTATLSGSMNAVPYPPGVVPTNECYIDNFRVEVYEASKMIGATNDLRGMTTLFPHPAESDALYLKTNVTDHLTVTKGYYEAVVQDAVALWANHVATGPVTFREGAIYDDGINQQQSFRWTYRPGGYLSLAHVAGGAVDPVLEIEAMDPNIWLVTHATGTVSTIMFTTNGLAGEFRLQTCSNLVVGAWVNAITLSTNDAPAGYMSLTASNTLGGSAAFWRASCTNATQAVARAVFSIPVQAPRFELAPGVYLIWSNGLRIYSGSSNGIVDVTWNE